MLELKNFMPIQFLKKEKFTGSHHGMRFRMEKLETEGEDGPRLGVTVWPEPYNFDVTPDEEKEKASFDFSADGIAEGVAWINQQYEEQRARWDKVSR
ncbi:hypothetical protein [Lacrimispora sp. 210928-DFI.3.58]|uniref:hypothetical protein n=1 Tax=Lacrimispora sp. 210928-DFI.3.58 TaxID=2883214 RepID=UPI0015B48320|nr:hypothetical protein [Lacrimispora sp. 210928-DFI.3.58]MCB7319034.1 hypothetical protein [Lacrimispora sp. 210928-DFI.3.58]